MKYFYICLFCLLPFCGAAQFKNNVWCFGDSAGIKFLPGGGTQLFNSSTLTRGGSCTIADSAGNLLLYANTFYYPLWSQGYLRLGVAFDRNHNLMQNGDTLVGSGLFQEQVIVPWPDSSNLFYLFTAGVFAPFGFWYSVIDLNQNGGLGAVVQKNVQLTNYEASDCVAAVKHGNGRDWWVLFKDYMSWNNSIYTYLITPNGISGPFLQNIGFATNTNFMHSTFSRDGNKYLMVNYKGLIEVYDFDRCTGLFSNVITIEPELPSALFPHYFGCAFSPSGNLIYITTVDYSETFLYQFDLLAPNITASKLQIESVQAPSYHGSLRLAPDNKIYCAYNYYDGINNYPYSDSLNNNFNQNLSVINFPDSAGLACGFSPFSFNLGGNETYWGLPNNPEYDLGPLSGSSCDTIVGINEPATVALAAELFVYYAPDWQTAFINANKLRGTQYHLEVFDLMGKSIFRESGKISPPYFTKNLICNGYSKGMYIVNLQTDQERLSKRFVVQ